MFLDVSPCDEGCGQNISKIALMTSTRYNLYSIDVLLSITGVIEAECFECINKKMHNFVKSYLLSFAPKLKKSSFYNTFIQEVTQKCFV